MLATTAGLMVVDLFLPWHSVNLAPVTGLDINATSSGLTGAGSLLGSVALLLAVALAVVSAMSAYAKSIGRNSARLLAPFVVGCGFCLPLVVTIKALMHSQYLGYGTYGGLLISAVLPALAVASTVLGGAPDQAGDLPAA